MPNFLAKIFIISECTKSSQTFPVCFYFFANASNTKLVNRPRMLVSLVIVFQQQITRNYTLQTGYCQILYVYQNYLLISY